jgi:hypothetical protein
LRCVCWTVEGVASGAVAVKLVAEGDRLRVEIDLAPDDG